MDTDDDDDDFEAVRALLCSLTLDLFKREAPQVVQQFAMVVGRALTGG